MDYREYAKELIDQIPESNLLYVMCFLQGAALTDSKPSAKPAPGGMK